MLLASDGRGERERVEMPATSKSESLVEVLCRRREECRIEYDSQQLLHLAATTSSLAMHQIPFHLFNDSKTVILIEFAGIA